MILVFFIFSKNFYNRISAMICFLRIVGNKNGTEIFAFVQGDENILDRTIFDKSSWTPL